MVCHTFITSTQDLFLVIKKDGSFIVKHLDLDNLNHFESDTEPGNFRFQDVLTYSSEEVDNCNLSSFFVRGSSAKEKINTNHKLMMFMLHEENLFTWTEGKPPSDEKQLSQVNDPS